MGILEQFYEQWMQHQMNKHNRILQQEETRMKGLSSQVNDLDQTAEAFEHKMEMAAIEIDRWIKEKTRAN